MESFTIAFLVISVVLQATAVVLALRLMTAARAWRTWRAWFPIVAGLTLLVMRRALMLTNALQFMPVLSSPLDEPLSEGTNIVAWACIALGTVTLSRHLTQTETASRRQREKLAAVYRIGLATTSTLALDDLLCQIHNQVRQIAPFDAFSIALYDPASSELQLEQFVDGSPTTAESILTMNEDGGLMAWIARSRQVLRIGDMEVEQGQLPVAPRPQEAQARSWLGLPLFTKDRIVGVMSVQSNRLNAFTADDEQLLATVAAQAAIAIENAQLYRSVRASEERYRTLIENANDWIWTLDQQGHFAFANKQAEKATGHKLQDWLGKSFAALIVPDDLPNVQRVFAETLAGKSNTYEASIFDARGQIITLAINTAPLLEEGRVVGAVSFGRNITGRKKTEQELYRSNRDLAALNAIASTVSQSLDMTKILNDTLDKTLAVMQLDGEARGGIFLLDERVGELHLEALHGLPAEFIERETTVKLDKCLCGHVIETGEIVDSTQAGVWRAKPGWVEPHGHLLVPLKSKGKVLGVMFLYLPAAHRPDAPELQLLAAIGNQIGMGIENAQLYERLRGQAQDLELLYEVGRLFPSSLEPQEVLSQVARRCTLVFEADSCVVCFVENGLLKARGSHFRDDIERAEIDMLLSANPIHTDAGLAGSVVATGRPALSAGTDLTAWTSPDYADLMRSREWLLAPLCAQGRTFGVLMLTVRRKRRRRFSEHDLVLAQEVANQAAAALENARLYQAERQQRELAVALREAGIALSATLDFDTVLDRLLDQIGRVVPYDSANVMLVEGERIRMARLRSYEQFGAQIAEDVRRLSFKIADTPNLRRMAETGQPLVIPDTTTDPGWVRVETVAHIRSWAGAPIIAKGQLVAFFSLDKVEPNFYRPEHADRLASFAGQAALALENARLYQAERKQRERAETLREAALALTTTLDRDKVIERILAQLQEVVPYDSASVQLLRGDQLEIVGGRGFPNLQDLLGICFPVGGDNPNSEVVRTLAPFIVENGPAVYEEFRRAPHAPAGIRSWLGVPMLVGEQLIGMIALDKREPGFYSQEHAHLAQAFAAQAAIALENARLYQETVNSLARLQALSQISRAVSSSLDLSQVLATIARHAAELSDSDAAGIFELDKARQVLVISASYNASPEFVEAVHNAGVKLGEGAIGRAALTLRPVEVTDTETEPGYPFRHLAALGGYRSILAVPMFSHDQLVGSIVLWRKRPQPFDKDIVELLSTLADHSVVAIENARLFREASRRLEEVTLIQAIALEGATGRPFDDIVANATERLRHLWSSHLLGFIFPDETGALRLHPSYYGALTDTQRNMRFSPSQGITGWVFQTGQPLVVPDVRQEPLYLEVTPETRSEMAAPLVVDDRVIGVINVESPHLNAFSTDDARLLTALAGQLAIILDNMQAHRDLAVRAQQLQAAYDGLAEAEQVKDQMVQNLSHELRMPLTFIRGYIELIMEETFGPLPIPLHKPLETVNQKTNTVVHLVERIVNLQTVHRDTLAVEALPLTDLIEQVALRWQPQAERSDIAIGLDLPPYAPKIAGDRQMLAEAFDNLFSNAIKFNYQGGRVEVSLQAGPDLVHATIADTGIGIPPDKLSKVFDRFYQVDGTTRRRFGGAGVGLALVRRIVLAHGGRVWAESDGPGRGSTFHLAFPTAPAS